MNKIKFNKVIVAILIIFTIITGLIPENNYPVKAAEIQESNTDTYYRLYTGAYYIWCNSAGTWQYTGSPGGTINVESTFTAEPGAKIIDIFPYNPSASGGNEFKFDESTHYKWYKTAVASNKNDYDEEYYTRAAQISSVAYNISDYDSSTGRQTVKYNVTLNANRGPINLKEMLGRPDGKQKLIDYIGTASPEMQEIMELMTPGENNYSPKVQGYLYFIPIVVKYEMPPKNNLQMVSVEFLDFSGNVTTEPIAGRIYTVRYNIKYTGTDMTSPVNVTVEQGHIRNTKKGNNYYWTSPWSKSKAVQLKDGESFSMEVGTFKIDEPNIYACGTIRRDEIWNTNNTDDFGEKEINGIVENLTLTIESISPAVTKIYSPQSQATQDYEIVYNINYIAAKNADITTDLVLTLNSNSFTNPKSMVIPTTIELSPGINRLSINTGAINVKNADGEFSVSLEVNKSRTSPIYELTYIDNKDTVIEKIQSITNVINPCAGEINRENPSWVVSYNISTKTGAWLETGYHGSHTVDGKTYPCTHSRCVGGSINYWTVDSTRTESLEITNVNFTSKDSGTVNMLKKDGKIKAGYGFDLEIIAKYTGTENPSRPATWGGCNYQKVSPGPYVLNSLPNNIYIILPDGQIISNTASKGINNLMDCYVTENSDLSRTLRCQVKIDNTFGNKETRKLYVDENTRDGTYDMTVCTAKFDGVSPKATKPLFDKRKVSFTVDGKHTDDIRVNIIQ